MWIFVTIAGLIKAFIIFTYLIILCKGRNVDTEKEASGSKKSKEKDDGGTIGPSTAPEGIEPDLKSKMREEDKQDKGGGKGKVGEDEKKDKVDGGGGKKDKVEDGSEKKDRMEEEGEKKDKGNDDAEKKEEKELKEESKKSEKGNHNQKDSDRKSDARGSKEDEGGKESENKDSSQKEEEEEKESAKKKKEEEEEEKEGDEGGTKKSKEKVDKRDNEKEEGEKKNDGKGGEEKDDKESDKKDESEKKKQRRKKGKKGEKKNGEEEREEKEEKKDEEKEAKKEDEKKEVEEKEEKKEEEKEKKEEVTYDPKELKFTIAGGVVKLTTKNDTNQRQALKVKCSDNFLYRVNPVFSFVEPGAEQVIEIIRQPGNPKTDKLVLVHTPAAPGEVDAPPLFKKPIAYQNYIIPLRQTRWMDVRWTEHYDRELSNFEEFGDEGEIWFGRVAERRIVEYITGSEQLSKSSSFIDFGCGNGSLLRALRRRGYSHLCGIDYSEEAVLLATKLSGRKCLENSSCQITFRTLDLLSVNTDLGKFDVVLDKGTWDALSLSDDRDSRLRKIELERQFSGKELGFFKELPSKNTIEFGGQKGSTTTTVHMLDELQLTEITLMRKLGRIPIIKTSARISDFTGKEIISSILCITWLMGRT
uniref:MSP domain-containing protein n=1 Tax=Setaria digitata TaxID=48799 RepID=A0A915Q6H0_9BILA